MAPPPNSVSIASGSSSVQGFATNFVAAAGDLLVAKGTSAVILSRSSATELVLKQKWPGPAITETTEWDILSTSPYWQSNVATSRKLTDLLERFDAGPIKWDASGSLPDRDNYNDQSKNFVFLSTYPRPFTLYVKTSNENSATAWSSGQILGDLSENTAQLVESKAASDVVTKGGLRINGVGTQSLPNVAAVDAYTLAARELAYDGSTVRVGDGVTRGGIRLLTAALLGAVALMPLGATVATSLAGLFGRTITVLDFGCRPDAVVAADGSVSGTDNAVPMQRCSDWCRDNGRKVIVPPGRYLSTKTITAYTDIDAAGAQIVMPYAPDATIVVVENMPGDETTIPLAEVRSWTGWRRRARRMGGLSGRRGEYIALDTGDQVQINRVGAPAIRFGEGFRVADDSDVLAHTLFGDANNAAWNSGTFVSKKVRHSITVQGLRLAFSKPPGTVTGVAGCGLENRRPNVRFVGNIVENLSGLQVAQGFVDSAVCDVTHEDGFVRGLMVVSTNYGWNSNLSAGITYYRCREEYCRRGIDAHKGKHIDIISCELPDGWGTHYGWWMQSIGGTLGASTANNASVVGVAGGGFSVSKAQINVTKAANTVARIRSDLFEGGDSLIVEDCNIVIDADTVGPTLLGVQGSAAGFDYGRAVEMPRLLKCTGNTIEVRGANTILRLVQWLMGWDAAAFPRGCIVDSRWEIGSNTFIFPDGGPVLPNGTLRVEIQANKPETATGSGITAVIADLPCLSLVTIAPVGGRTTATRFSGRIERIDGQVSYKWVYGSYGQVLVDAGSLAEGIISGTNSTPVGGENILRSFRSGLMVSETVAGFVLPNGVPLTVADVDGMVNRVTLSGGATGVAPKFQASGTDSNVGLAFGTRGTAAFTFFTSFTVAQFQVTHTPSAVNFAYITGGVDNGDCLLGVSGTGTTGHLALGARGTAGTVKTQRPFGFAPYTFATLPSAGVFNGTTVRVTDRNNRLAHSDGTNWRYGDNSIAA